MSKYINLSQGRKVLVDDEVFEELNKYCWSFNSRTKYAERTMRIGEKFKKVQMHRIIANTPEGLWTDHINHDRLDNRKANLRSVTKQQNGLGKIIKPGKDSRYKGVSKRGANWDMRISLAGNRPRILFEKEHHAALAYDLWATDLHKEFAVTNFPVINSQTNG